MLKYGTVVLNFVHSSVYYVCVCVCVCVYVCVCVCMYVCPDILPDGDLLRSKHVGVPLSIFMYFNELNILD